MNKHFWYILIIVIVSILYFNQCTQSAQEKKIYEQNLSASLDSIQFFKNKLGQEVSEKKSYISTNKKLSDIISKKDMQLQEAIRKFKSVKGVVKIVTETIIDTVKTPFKEPINYTFSRNFKKHHQWYSFDGTVTNLGLTISKLSIPNTQIVVFGKRKISLFKTEIRAEVTNSNPFIKTTSLDSYQFIEKQKRWGIGAGFGLDLFTLKPTINLSINYDLVRF